LFSSSAASHTCDAIIAATEQAARKPVVKMIANAILWLFAWIFKAPTIPLNTAKVPRTIAEPIIYSVVRLGLIKYSSRPDVELLIKIVAIPSGIIISEVAGSNTNTVNDIINKELASVAANDTFNFEK